MNKLLDIIANEILKEKLYNELYIVILEKMIYSPEYEDIITDLYNTISNDNLIYKNLTLEEIDLYLDKLNQINNEFNVITRIKNKLLDRKNILSKTYDTINISNDIFENINDKFILTDLMEYYILVNTYRFAYSSIINTLPDNKGDKIFKEKLLDNFYISLIESMSTFELAETIGLQHYFNIDNLPSIDIINLIDNSTIIDPKYYYLSLVERYKSLINDIFNYTDKNNSLKDVFDTLLILSEIETLLFILKEEYLEIAIEYFNFNASFKNNSLFKTNIRRLIRKRNEELKD